MGGAIQIAIYILEGLFLLGIAGSVLVILLSTVEDVEVFITPESTAAEQNAGAMAPEPSH